MRSEEKNKIKYYIITPTYNRPESLIRCVESVLAQSYFNLELLIVNDSPDYDYSTFEYKYIDTKLTLKDNPNNVIDPNTKNIKYFKNKKNMGVNFSRNFALDYISKENFDLGYIIFLDDDDWLEVDALQNIANILENEKEETGGEKINWLMTNRALSDKTSLSHIRKNKINNFNLEFLLLRRSFGDVTHTIEKSLALSSRFSNKIKQGEEWIYFSNLKSPILYKDINTTISEGYSVDGLNTQMSAQDKKNKIKNILSLFVEKSESKSSHISKILIYIYLFLRLVKTIKNSIIFSL